MKKQLRKPEHWQDFESLCKKLWGEVWQVPHAIKKHGRMGQEQCGVDIYAIPKGESNYWGIQCKGKDDYTGAKLTLAEIDREIAKARMFTPALAVFIIATTANKDVVAEEYVREKDVESRQNGGFGIQLYSWEDIADLIEENRDTFNYYVLKQQYREQYDFKVSLKDFCDRITIRPVFTREIRRYRVKRTAVDINERTRIPDSLSRMLALNAKYREMIHIDFKNYAQCAIEINLQNTGSCVIEDWKLIMEVEESAFTELTTIESVSKPGGIMVLPKTTSVQTWGNKIVYLPMKQSPLVQTDSRTFTVYIEPLPQNYDMKIEWSLIARDFNHAGELIVAVEPVYEEDVAYVYVESTNDLKPDEIIQVRAKKYKPAK